MTTLPKLVILCIFVHLVAALPLKVLSPRQVPNAVNKVTCQILGVKLAVSALNPEEMDILRGCEDTHSNFAQQSRISASGVGSGAGAGHGGASGAGGSREGVSRAAAGPVRNNASSTSGTTTTAGTKSIDANNPSTASTPAGDFTSATPNHSTGAAAGASANANPSANSSANTRVGSNAIPGSSSEAPTRGPATANDSAVTATQNNDLSSSESEANTTNADRRVNPLRLNPGEPAASTGPPSGPSTDGPASAVSLASADPTGDAGSAVSDPHEDSSAAPASGPTVEGDSSSAESSVSSSAAHGDSASAGPSVSTPTAPGGSVSAAPPTSNAPASDSSVSAAASEQPASAPATPDSSSSLNAAANPSSNSGTSPSSQSQSGAHQVSTSSHSSTPSHAGGGGSAAGTGGRSAFQMDSVRNRPNAASIANDRAAAAQNRGGLSSLSLLGGDVTKSPSEFTPSRGVTNGVEDSAAGGATSVANSAASQS
ncbi:hypothetical protein EUX98_g1905 [Antrodiella citrinella]|uniref:Uncharacterized protein n=1 Tax=Antrodiella citrinella TaxID=2447956 RepID=A0A4S4N8P1_9APHY|nr:hypothetical protein EUX98_g1905 [Antrodiella citrinella]